MLRRLTGGSQSHGDANPYVPYVTLMEQIHPFQFFDAHDPGDEDRNTYRDEWMVGP